MLLGYLEDKIAVTDDINIGLIFMGIALSFSSLANKRKKSKIGEKVFGSERNTKIWLIYLIVLFFALLGLGLYSMLKANNEALQNMATGLIVLGIGVIGLLKSSMDIAHYYQVELPKEDGNT